MVMAAAATMRPLPTSNMPDRHLPPSSSACTLAILVAVVTKIEVPLVVIRRYELRPRGQAPKSRSPADWRTKPGALSDPLLVPEATNDPVVWWPRNWPRIAMLRSVTWHSAGETLA